MQTTGEFITDASAFLPSDIYGGEPDGLWHVTVARNSVTANGLRSRSQLGGAVQGLGGGHDNQAPDLVSLTWCSGKASDIEETLRLAVLATRDEIPASEVFGRTARRYGTDWFGDIVRAVLRTHGVPDLITDDDFLSGLEDWLDSNILGGDRKYRFLQDIDDAMEREFDRDLELPVRVGLTAPLSAIAAVDPEQICTFRVALRAGAAVETVEEEAELRARPWDVMVIGYGPDLSGIECPVATPSAMSP